MHSNLIMYFIFANIILIITSLFSFYFLLNAIVNVIILNKIYKFKATAINVKVSVLIPARNEEKGIGDCVKSVLNQDYSNFEVIVLNDNSTDNTGKILNQLKKKDSRLKVISGTELPKGWVGKNWACHQLSKCATGEYYLYIDADTKLKKDFLSKLLTAMKTENVQFISVIPEYIVRTWSEKLVLPFLSFCYLGLMPLYFGMKYNLKHGCMAIGTFLFFQKDAYNKIGGFEKIKSAILDDNAFAKEICKHGIPWRFYNGANLASCRMYRNFREVFFGFGKNAYSFFNDKLIVFIFALLFFLFMFFFPIFVLITSNNFNYTYLSIILSIISIVFILFGYGLILSNTKEKIYYALYYFLTIFFWVIIAMFSVYRYKVVLKQNLGRNVYDHQKKSLKA